MVTVLGCIVDEHNIWLVILAILICGVGSWATIGLFYRAARAIGMQRAGWYVLTAVAAGAAIWCTHFIAMLGFRPGTPVSLDPVLTIVSLLVAIIGSTLGFIIAGSGLTRLAPALGGAVVGLTIATMHYVGMVAYRVEGLVTWDMRYLVASIMLSVGLSAVALWFAMRRICLADRNPADKYVAAGVLALAVVALHFTGMAAFQVQPIQIGGSFSNPAAMQALAFAVAGVAVLIVGAALSSSLIDDSVRAESSEALSNMSNGLVMVAGNGTIRLYNKRVLEMFDLAPDELSVGMTLEEYLRHKGARYGWGEPRMQHIIDSYHFWMSEKETTRTEHHYEDGKVMSISCRPMKDGGAILIYDDVTEVREGQKKIAHMAFHDALTGLPNRVSFIDRLDHEILLAHERGGKLALIGIDLDHFKEVNDLRGHTAGDELLKVLARRMSGLLRDGEFVARVGGDEFVAIQRMDDQAGLLDFLARLETALFNPIRFDEYEVITGASIGVTIFPDDATKKETLIGNADLAMYRSKADLSRVVCFYEPGMDETVRARRALAGELREAIENNQLDIHYQVQTSVSTGEVRGYEALLRWEHPKHGFIPPSEFISIAEENGLILQIGEWVLREACAKAASWKPPCKVAVNLSAVQFAHADLPKLVQDVLAETGLTPERLELELTETTIFVDKERSLHTLRQIKALGVSIALDDFGTGYSSLDTLRSFPFDKIKLDRSFISEVESSPHAKAIIRAVLALGKSLEIPVLAEGIETEGQLGLLNTEGCDEVQGYLFGRPASLQQLVSTGKLTLIAGTASSVRPRAFSNSL